MCMICPLGAQTTLLLVPLGKMLVALQWTHYSQEAWPHPSHNEKRGVEPICGFQSCTVAGTVYPTSLLHPLTYPRKKLVQWPANGWKSCICLEMPMKRYSEYIVVNGSSVKSAFCHMKWYPDIINAFSFIVADTLYLSYSLPFCMESVSLIWRWCNKPWNKLPSAILMTSPFQTNTANCQYLSYLKYDQSVGKTKPSKLAKAWLNSLSKAESCHQASHKPSNQYSSCLLCGQLCLCGGLQHQVN